ncbi:MAG: hypothetical protein ACTII7_08545 [Galactobacter sp.]
MSAFYGIESPLPAQDARQARSAIGSLLQDHEERTERRRRSSIPEGRDLELTQAVLKEFAQLADQHRMSEARQLLASVHPEEDAEHPALLHVIGAGTTALDQWATQPDLKAAARNVKLVKWGKPATKAARDLLDAARTAEAYASLEDLVNEHGWEAAFEGVAVATASLLAAVARKRGVKVQRVSETLLPDASGPVPRRASWQTPSAEIPSTEETSGAEDAPQAPSVAQAAPQASAETEPSVAVGQDTAAELAATPVVAGIAALAEWIGDGATVTASGQLRRADIEAVAALLGMHARGVAKRPADGENGTLQDSSNPLQVRSAADVAALGLWWDVLVRGGVLEVAKTRVQVAAADKYVGETSTEDAEGFVAAYVLWAMNSLLEAEAASAKKAAVPAADVAAEVGQALVAAANAAAPVERDRVASTDSPVSDVLSALEDVQILGRNADGDLSVPLELRNAVLNAVAGMKAYAPEAFAWFQA